MENTKQNQSMKQVILHIPHSSINIPFKDGYIISDEELNREILKLTDWYTDDLFYSKGNLMIVADFSRIFCDPERFADDSQEIMSKYGMGVVYEKSDDGKIIRNVNPVLRDKIITQYYLIHHQKLHNAVKNQLSQHKKSLIIDCHSFPNTPFKRDLNKNPNRPDFNIGMDKFHTSSKLVDISLEFFKSKNHSVEINSPYEGSIVPSDYYQKNENVQSIMLEVNRKLYLNDLTNSKSEKYNEIKNIVKEFIDLIKTS